MRISDWSSDVCSSDLGIITARQYILPPSAVVEIPAHRVRHTFFEGQRWFPAQLFLNLGRLNGIAMVLAGAVSHKGDLFSIGFSVGAGDRKSVVLGMSGSVRVDLGGRRSIKKKKK